MSVRPNRMRIRKNVGDAGEAIKHAELAREDSRYKDVPIINIELDPDQPRQLNITSEEVINGIDERDEDLKMKMEELEEIKNMALTQGNVGTLYAPVGYELPGQRVRLIDGHRRFLAQLYKVIHIDNVQDGSTDINNIISINKMTCKVYPTKPPQDVIDDIAIIGNIQRKELNVYETLNWAFRRNEQHQAIHEGKSLGTRFFIEKIGLRSSQASKWNRIVTVGREQLKEAIEALESGELTQLEQIYTLASESNKRKRKILLDRMRKRKYAIKKKSESKFISLGRTENLVAIKSLINVNADVETLEKIDGTDWSKPSDVQRAFKLFLMAWEKRYGN